MTTISISTAWEDTKRLLARDGKLFASVALALIVLPAVIAGVLDPRVPGEVDAPMWFDLVVLLISLISIAGQLALIRLGLGPSVTVAGAISHGVHRFVPYFLAIIVLGLGAIVVAIPFAIAAIAMGLDIAQGSAAALTGPILILILVMALVLLFLSVRFLMAMPVASAEAVGPIEILKRSWALTDGHWLKLFLFLILFIFSAILLIGAVSLVAGSLILLAFKAIEPMSIAALIGALIEGALSGIFSVVFTLMLTRMYVQLSGRDTVASAA
ncbi:MAG: glycerophosphoryl diester phosphodiesterase membrane domain-containing protein [Sphingomicrobium sp.]